MYGLKKAIVPLVAALVLMLGACGIDLEEAAGDPEAAATGAESQASQKKEEANTAEKKEEKKEEKKTPEDDVSVAKECKVGQFGMVEAKVTVKNSGDKNRSYLITVSANDKDGNRVAELNGAANAIKPGQSAKVDTIGQADGLDEGTVLTCEVANVTVI